MRKLLRNKLFWANIALVLVLGLGASYLAVDVMRLNPLKSTYTVTVSLDRSGGLQPGNDVTLRGWRIGKINSIKLADQGGSIAAEAQIDSNYHIPRDTRISVNALSAAGEQYIDFRPDSDKGPFLHNGEVIRFDPDKITTPTPVWAVLDDASSLIAQVDPERFSAILTELDTALSGGPDQLRNMINALSTVTAGLDGLLPQTVNLLKNLQVIAGTTSHAQPDLQTLTNNSSTLFNQLQAANDEVSQVLDRAPAQVRQLGAVLDKNADPITSLASNFVAITKAAELRGPALQALFPSLALGLDAMGVPAHDGEFYTILDIWPRPFCQYDHVPIRNEVVQDGTLPKYNYCTNPAPNQQVRGSANAPRPDIPDNGAQMPAGADPNARTPQPVR
ncbi:MlaD family protein [Nocardia stercoris]|uniref:MCE family protein n=1 Tax=Nocardia stercoris TaxID=2483361 RepID=A0A3M2L8X1_9NOCA|nr:MlaD family protein [Nocardia stercoris]RMI34061.1 MCE family protein [Nocardia stercoris]